MYSFFKEKSNKNDLPKVPFLASVGWSSPSLHSHLHPAFHWCPLLPSTQRVWNGPFYPLSTLPCFPLHRVDSISISLKSKLSPVINSGKRTITTHRKYLYTAAKLSSVLSSSVSKVLNFSKKTTQG